MIEDETELAVALLNAGFMEGLEHFDRCGAVNDLALAACN